MQSINTCTLKLPHQERTISQEKVRLTHLEEASDHENTMSDDCDDSQNRVSASAIAIHPLNLTLLSKRRTVDTRASPNMEQNKRRRVGSADDDDTHHEASLLDQTPVHDPDRETSGTQYSKKSILQHFHSFIQRKKDQGEIVQKPKPDAMSSSGADEDKADMGDGKNTPPTLYEPFAPLYRHDENNNSDTAAVPTSPRSGYSLDYNAAISRHLARSANAANFLDIWNALTANVYANVRGRNSDPDRHGTSPTMPPLTSVSNDDETKSGSAGSFTSSPTPITVIPERTMRQNNWAVKVWRDWAIERNSIANLKGETGPYDIVPMDIKDASVEGMSFWLPRFITEVRRRDKRPYPPDTLMQIASGLQRHLRHVSGRSDITFFDKYSPTFAEFREALKARSEAINSELNVSRRGSDHDTSSVDGVSDYWSNTLFDLNTAKGLFRAIFYHNCVAFHITSMEEHHALAVAQFRIAYDDKLGQEYLEFTRESGQPVRKLATPYDPRCIVKVFKKYFQHIPSTGLLYKRPLQSSDGSELRFSFNPVGINKLRETFKILFGGRRTGCHLQGLDEDDERDAPRLHSSEDDSSRGKFEHSPGSDASSVASYLRESRMRDGGVENKQPLDGAGDQEHSMHRGEGSVNGDEAKACDATRPKILIENNNNNATVPEEEDSLTLKVPKYVKNVIVQQGNKRIKIDLTNMT